MHTMPTAEGPQRATVGGALGHFLSAVCVWCTAVWMTAVGMARLAISWKIAVSVHCRATIMSEDLRSRSR